MKLVDILADRLIDWPRNTELLVQGNDGLIFKPGEGIRTNHVMQADLAEDWELAVVTRKEWLAAVEEKNVAPQNDESQNVARIDWSKAPEGATHFCSARNGWLKRDEHDMWLSWSPYGRHYEEQLIGWCFCHDPADVSILIPRDWNGEGLPPVGSVCETDADGGWEKVTVIAHDLGSVIIRRLQEKGFYVYDPVDASQLRPARTPEQVAADDLDRIHAEALRLNASRDRFILSGRCLLGNSARAKTETRMPDEDMSKP